MQPFPWFDVQKLHIECQDEPEFTICIEWDETDPDLEAWTKMNEDEQSEFILTALRNACNEALETNPDEQH